MTVVGTSETAAALDELRLVLAGHVALDDQEQRSIEEFLRQLDTLEQPLDEHAATTHVTASAVVVGRRGILLHRHKRLGIWIQPGGHIDPGEHPADAALREVVEETGLVTTHFGGSPTIVHVDVHPAPKGHTHLDLRFVLRGPDADPNPPEGESPDVAWLSFEAARQKAAGGLDGLLGALVLPVTLRMAQPSDTTGIVECYLASFDIALPGVRAHSPQHIRATFEQHCLRGRNVTVAHHRLGMIVGFLVTSPGWIEQLYIDPAWQQRGIGAALLHRAQADQPNGTQLWSFQQNTVARTFYERNGFVAQEFTDGATNEERTPDVRYRWPSVAASTGM